METSPSSTPYSETKHSSPHTTTPQHHSRTSTTTSSTNSSKPDLQASQSSNFFTYPMTYAVSGILRRLSSEPISTLSNSLHSLSGSSNGNSNGNGNGLIHTPKRVASPFQPPPLTPLTLTGWRSSTQDRSKLLSRSLAEEIRLLLPARLQLCESWDLIYSLEQNGTSLSTLYTQTENYRGRRGGFVLVIRDGSGGTFGAYLSDALHPAPHYYGNGECFLWKASLHKMLDLTHLDLPPPPSEDTTHAQRTTTLLSPKTRDALKSGGGSGTSTPERIRFKAFPYSGVNDYMIFCEPGYLSVGGGDGHYGLWLDDNLDKGISSTCLTFGNEPLSEEGTKFEVMGVELWYLGS